MQSKHNKQLVPFAKQLREEMTKEERHANGNNPILLSASQKYWVAAAKGKDGS